MFSKLYCTVLFILTLFFHEAILFSGFVSQPSDDSRGEGERVYFNCIVETLDTNEYVSWLHNRRIISNNDVIVLDQYMDRYTIDFDSDFGKYNLKIRNIQRIDKGQYECVIYDSNENVVSKSWIANLTVLEIPQGSYPICQNTKMSYIVGQRVLLACISETISPLALLKWKQNDIDILTGITELKARETVPVEKETVPVAKKPTKPPPPPPTTTVPTTEPPTTTTKTTTKAAGPPSYRHCQDVRDSGFDINGNYMIDPDGVDGPMEEFEVYCNMTDNGAYTTIGVQQASTMPIRIKGLDDPGANVFTPEYLLNAEQILAVVTASTECRQYISYSCTSAVLLAYHKKKKLHHGWLLSRDGEEMINWGGAPTNSLSCACGVTGTCINDNVKCNCDANESKQKLSDSGYLDDIDTLPIKSVHLGDVAGKKEVGGLTLGSLECKV